MEFALTAEHVINDINAAAAIALNIGRPSLIIQAGQYHIAL
jgi:hypothetical protein